MQPQDQKPLRKRKSHALLPYIETGRVAVVARDCKNQVNAGPHRFRHSKKGFAPHMRNVISTASNNGADTVLFSLWSHNATKVGELSRTDLFPKGTHHSAVILGIVRRDQGSQKDKEVIEVWHRSAAMPHPLYQHFGKTSAPKAQKKQLIAELGNRQFGTMLVLLCGEVNIVKTQRSKPGIVDESGFLPSLRGLRIEWILNPVHSYMRRPEMRLKREALSRGGRIVISVWNRGLQKGSESKAPWAVYRDGMTVKDAVREIALPVPSQPGVRMGIIDLQDSKRKARSSGMRGAKR